MTICSKHSATMRGGPHRANGFRIRGRFRLADQNRTANEMDGGEDVHRGARLERGTQPALCVCRKERKKKMQDDKSVRPPEGNIPFLHRVAACISSNLRRPKMVAGDFVSGMQLVIRKLLEL